MTDVFSPPVDLLLLGAASALLTLIAWQRRWRWPLLWGAASLGAYAIVSQAVRGVLPAADQQFRPGEQPGASYVLWSNPAFRSDVALLVLVLGVLILLLLAARRLMQAVDDSRLLDSGPPLPPAPRWQRTASAVASALALAFPLIVWKWAALYTAYAADYTAILLPSIAFFGLAALAAVLWYQLESPARKWTLLGLIVVVAAAQLRYNATRPPGSMFESNGSFPFFISLVPIMLGVAAAGALKTTWPQRQVVLAAWRLAGLLWLAAGLGWLIRFLGVYNFQNSFAFDVASLLESPLRVLGLLADAYYGLVPRELADERQAAAMADWTAVAAFLAGAAAWLAVAVWTQRRAPQPGVSAAPWSNLAMRLSLQQKRFLLAFVLILPALGLRTFTSFYPFLQTIILSVQRYNPAFPPRRYVGFANFQRLSTDLVVRESLEFTLVFVFVSTFFQVMLGLAIAHLLNENFRLRGLARTISLIPWAIPMVVAAIGFKWMFDDQFGLIPDMMRRFFGYNGKWLVDPGNAQIAVIFVNIWKSTPFCALLLLAGLQGISLDLYEAAKVDGANWLDSLRFITFPMLLPIIVTITMFMLVWQLAVFDLPFAMTGGAPGFSTTVLAQKIYFEINSLNYSFASAVSIALVLVVTAIGGVGLYALRRVEVSA